MKFELTKEFLNELEEAIVNGNESLINERVSSLHEADIAEILEEVSEESAHYIYTYLKKDKAAEVLVELEEELREKLLAPLTSKEIAEQVIGNLDSDDAADVIHELPDDKVEEVIALIESEEHSSDIVELLHHAEGTAGAIMAKELVSINENLSALKCVAEIRSLSADVDFIYTVYVIDDQEKLLGTLSLRKLLLTPDNTKITEVYERDIIHVKTSTSSDEVAQIMDKYDLAVLPVVDELGRLVGRITIDDVVDVIREEADKDFQMASGHTEVVESTDTVWVLSRSRLPWLLIGLLGGILGAQVIDL